MSIVKDYKELNASRLEQYILFFSKLFLIICLKK